MKTPFRLDDHPRRPQPPLASPPAGYFDQLPRQIMARVQPEATSESVTWGWLTNLSRPLRTALASAVVLGGFSTAFYLSQPTIQTPNLPPTTALATVPDAALIEYLAVNNQLETEDLASLPLPDDNLMAYFLQASPQELEAALGPPTLDEAYY
ncbi:hypothetical protein H8B13_01600 [Hymenobacter sp. BT188]|uniref:hypothetical protein n=1 Tax=Hymenobacter sp. BT188 TaxID=2763504 RepID=UPI00165163E9|nr:hypothetical protein [Hymenobacter sp. BT188]MBC6605504.1 hypothetical protein [Hymenobacter sp. BT188]